MEGKVLAGRYRLLCKLGEGGMGSVWRAVHMTLGTPLAIKLIEPSIAQSAEALARFKREARSAAELRSVHVVQIIDYGVDDGVPFIAMELLEGESLAARLERLRYLPPSDTAIILSQVARALDRAHAAGIVHRDLKPENIYLVPESDENIAKVLDFGIAKKMNVLSSSSGVRTGTGAMLGTPYYMSPEQVLGQTNIDHRTDIWSLGIIAYQCLTGVRPFDRETLGALLMAICNDALPTPSSIAQVPPGFDAWFARAAARNPAERFQSAVEATAQLRAICGAPSGRPSSLPPTRGNTAFSASMDTHRPVPAETPLEMGQTAVPSSVTIRGRRQGKPRGTKVAVGVALLLTLVAVVALRSLEQQAPVGASSAAAPELTQGARTVDSSLPLATAGSLSPESVATERVLPSAIPSAIAPPAANGSADHATTLPRAARPLTSAKTAKAEASAAAVPPAPKPVASAAAGKTQPRNYERSVGF